MHPFQQREKGHSNHHISPSSLAGSNGRTARPENQCDQRSRPPSLQRCALRLLGLLFTVEAGILPAIAQDSSGRLSRVTNQSSQRYEINQTYGGQAYFKDNNIWVVNQAFANLFGMPPLFVGDLQGAAAAAFRIEDSSYQECGFGGKPDACRKIDQCILDLYFDESRTPLPWATDIKMQWKPSYSSMIWLRPLDVMKERPHGTLAIEPPAGITRNKGGNSAFIPFADPVSKVEASFVTNSNHYDNGRAEQLSGGMYLLGYMRDFYQNLSVVSLQFGCMQTSRPSVDIWLNSIEDGIFGKPIARFNKVTLPAGFVQQINGRLKAQRDRNTAFYRNLLLPSAVPATGTNQRSTNQ